MEVQTIKESLHFYNPWWKNAIVPSELVKEYHRPIIDHLFSYLSLDRVIVVKGPRRTGKTTLFYQMIEQLLRKGISSSNICFVSFDDIKLRIDPDEILKAYQEIGRGSIKKGEPIYLFLDEVHFLENWQFFVKKYFDRKYPIKFLVSGSAATLIKRGTESLAGRTVEEVILPFSFYEYLGYRKKNTDLMKKIDSLKEESAPFFFVDISRLIPDLPEIKMIFEEYLIKGGFPNLFDVEEELLWKRLVREDIVEKVIYRDLVGLYDIKKPEVLEKLFLYLAGITSQILSVANISNSLGLSREYTEKYLFYLEQALIVKRLKKFARSIEKSVRSAEKIHLLDSGLINSFSKVPQGQTLESVVASHLIRQESAKVYYFRERHEVDLVLEKDGKIVPIEIKYKDEISRRDLSGLLHFAKKFQVENSVVVTRDSLKEEQINGIKIVFFPAWLFLLLLGSGGK
jgi:predicted AAA+ superfamily ATPase